MPGEIRDKSVALISREEAIKAFDHDNVAISVHEHLDQEELFFENGKSVFYAQSLEEFMQQFSGLALKLHGQPLEMFCAAFFSCPIYERFRAIQLDRSNCSNSDIYYDANNRILEEIGVLQKAFRDSNPHRLAEGTSFLPLPFLFVDPNISASGFESQYAAVLDKVAGLKWHPFAQRKEPKDYVRAGYVDLAAQYHLPTVIHCERPGEKGDLNALFNDVSPHAEKARVPIDIAHMGFLHKGFNRIGDFEFSYIDMSPWSTITMADNDQVSMQARAELLAEFLKAHSNSMLFGMDTPFNWSLWSNGRKYGADVADEIKILEQAISLAGVEAADRLLNKNPRQFLKGQGCEL